MTIILTPLTIAVLVLVFFLYTISVIAIVQHKMARSTNAAFKILHVCNCRAIQRARQIAHPKIQDYFTQYILSKIIKGQIDAALIKKDWQAMETLLSCLLALEYNYNWREWIEKRIVMLLRNHYLNIGELASIKRFILNSETKFSENFLKTLDAHYQSTVEAALLHELSSTASITEQSKKINSLFEQNILPFVQMIVSPQVINEITLFIKKEEENPSLSELGKKLNTLKTRLANNKK